MRLLRGIILPTIIAAPIWMQALQIQFNGWSDFGRLDWGLGDWAFGLIFTLIGLLLIGLPAAARVAQLRVRAVFKSALLVIIGSIGGGLVAVFYIGGLAVLGGTIGDAFPGILAAAQFGLIPGCVVALVWTILNFDRLRMGVVHA